MKFFASLGAVSMAIYLAMSSTTFAANKCSSIQLRGHLSHKKITQSGGMVKLSVTAKNWGTRDVTNVNLRIDLPPGTQYAGALVLPKIKPNLKPINLPPKIYWTDFALHQKKTQKFELKVRMCYLFCSRATLKL